MSKALQKVKDLRPGHVVTDHVDTVEISKKARRLVPATLSRKLGRQGLVLAKHSPNILFIGGVVAGVAGTVVACRATLKAPNLLDAQKETRSIIVDLEHEDYSDADRRKDLTLFYLKSGVEWTKLYGPSFILGVTSIAALTGSHKILGNRYAGMSAAYAGATQAFEQYRERVREDAGDDKDREYRYGSKVVTETIDTPNGPKKVKKVVADLDSRGHSMYARLFDEVASKEYRSTPQYNQMFLQTQQNWATDKLNAQGHLFLNEVYDMLGLSRTGPGSQVGWLWKRGEPNNVDFGLYLNNPGVADFFAGAENAVWLDFNVQGEIWRELDNR